MSTSSSPALAAYIALVENSRRPVNHLDALDLLCAELGMLLALPAADATLRRAMAAALADGITVDRIDSVLLHLAAYAGMGPVERSFELLEQLLGTDTGHAAVERLRPKGIPEGRAQRVERGFGYYRLFHVDRAELQAPRFAPLSPDYYPSGMELMSHSFADAGLALRSREVASIACLAALGCCQDQLRFHVEVGLREGVTQAQLAAVLMLVQVHAGVPRAHNAAAIAAEVIVARG